VRRADGELEHGDRRLSGSDLEPYLDDLERLNAWFGGHALTRRAIRRLAGDVPGARPLVIADVGGSRGALARRLARDARRRNRTVTIIVVDRDEASLAMGVGAAKPYPEVSFVQADATALPLREGAVDIATASLTLHHLEPSDATRTLAEMRRASRLGVVINDLRRTAVTYALVRAATWLFARHRFARHDGPLSVRRAYSPAELRTLAQRAGFARLAIRRYPPLARLIAVAS
jgi:ubiquinone/menaquinone biosynthesis C-methylase UbiE